MSDLRLELVIVPVSDVDKAKAFYVDKAGFNADHDQRVNDQLRFVQLTPPGSACSIAIGEGITDAEPGSVKGLQLVTADIEAERTGFLERGLQVGEVEDLPWGRFLYFTDPDGNAWSVQGIVRSQ
jgi:catechol 2,3-dioxygenase-like lactoylglutathione lyase family enzyme